MNAEDFVEALAASILIMKINRLYYFLERVEELYNLGQISKATYLGQKSELLDLIEETTEDNPFNQLKKELNLTTL